MYYIPKMREIHVYFLEKVLTSHFPRIYEQVKLIIISKII